MYGRRDEYTPWSFVFPIALGVSLGILATDAVKLGVGLVMAKAVVESFNETARKQTTPGHLPARIGQTSSAPADPPIRYGSTAFHPELPGLREANEKRLDRACIGGTISLREPNGWSQDTSNGSPMPCVERRGQ